MAQECRTARHHTGPGWASRTEPLEPNSYSSKNSSGTLGNEFIREERGSRVHMKTARRQRPSPPLHARARIFSFPLHTTTPCRSGQLWLVAQRVLGTDV